jgi:hypothetical protein
MTISFITLRVEHDDSVKDLADKCAGRVYTLSGVDNCEAVSESLMVSLPVKDGLSNGHGEVSAQMAAAMDSTMGQLS